MFKFLEGKKTYLTMVVMIILAAINGWNEYCATDEAAKFCFNIQIPDFVFALLATLGIYTRKVAKL